MNTGIKLILSMVLIAGIGYAHASRTYSKDWVVANIIGSLSEKSSFKYYLEPQLRVIDTPSIFNQFLFLIGLGYQFNPDIMLFVGPGWIPTKTTANNEFLERRLWQQLNWRLVNHQNITLNSRTRMEARKHSTERLTAYRLRQRLWLRFPVKGWDGYSFSCYDEVFFNLNHPEWTSPHLFEQNRGFVGIAKSISKTAILDIGYLNQFFHSYVNQSDNVVLLSITMIS